jgi:hypothetical protein
MAERTWPDRAAYLAASDPMTCAELVVARESLGLTAGWIAKAAGVNPRNERRWEAGDSKIPAEVQAIIDTLGEITTAAVTHLADRLRYLTDRGIILLRTDADYQSAATTGGLALPARWHHHVAARAAQLYPALLAFQGERGWRGNWLHTIVTVPNLGIDLGEPTYTTTRTTSPDPAEEATPC